MAKKSEAEDLVGQVLDSQDLRQALATALSKGTTSTTTTTVDEELGHLFHRRSSENLNTTPPLHQPTPRYLLRNHFGNMKKQKTSNRMKTHGGAHPYFHKDVILLCRAGDKNVIKQGEKEALYQRGHVLSAFQFCKNWDSYTVLQKLSEAFGPKVPADVRLQILMGCGNKLVVPALYDGQDLTGLLVHKVFSQKPIYLRPSRDLYNVSGRLETFGLSKHNSGKSRCIFTFTMPQARKLSADKMDDLFTIIFSPEGSNQKMLETMVVSFLRDYLQDVEDGQATTTLSDILIFATGSDCIPPIGFTPHPTIDFLHNDQEDFNQGQFPKANTCVNSLKLPIINNYEQFKEKMDFAFCNTQGFGRK